MLLPRSRPLLLTFAATFLSSRSVANEHVVHQLPVVHEEESAEAEPTELWKPPGYDWPNFMNWDCIGVRKLVDWDAFFWRASRGIRGEELYEEPDGIVFKPPGRSEGNSDVPRSVTFFLPAQLVQMMAVNVSQLREECPLGVVYAQAIIAYGMMLAGDTGDAGLAVRQAELVVAELRRYPFFVIAAGRWPTFESLNYLSYIHKPQSTEAAKGSRCAGVRGGRSGLDWDHIRLNADIWSREQMYGLDPGEGYAESANQLKAAAAHIFEDPMGKGLAAHTECPFGFLFLAAMQAMAFSARLTGSFEDWCRMVDVMLSDLPFFSVAGSGWPTLQLLSFFAAFYKGGEFSALNEGFQADVYRWGSSHPTTKRFRQYGDLRLFAHELQGPWVSKVDIRIVDSLAQMGFDEWQDALRNASNFVARPIVFEVLATLVAVLNSAAWRNARHECGHSGMTMEACVERGCLWSEDISGLPWQLMTVRGFPRCTLEVPKRKIVGITFVWGAEWAPIVPRFVVYAAQLRLGVIIIAMGEACRTACETSVATMGGTEALGVGCWDPLRMDTDIGASERGSILQRHVVVHLLLHLGIDVFAFDFDTFFFADPRARLEALAKEKDADILMTRHLDGDCLNMGLVYLRASARSAEWYSKYLGWLHQHPFEREQRGVNALLGFTKQHVSFAPKDLPPVSAFQLDDINEFASSRGGWLGNWSQLKFFHWVNPEKTPQDWSSIKVSDLQMMYAAALHPVMSVSLTGGSFASLLGWAPSVADAHAQASAGEVVSAPMQVIAAREIIASMIVTELPERRACW